MNDNKLTTVLKSEKEILKMCLNEGIDVPLITGMINEIDGELRNPKLKKHRVHKILIQTEKIFNSNERFKSIVRKLPRIYDGQQYQMMPQENLEPTPEFQ